MWMDVVSSISRWAGGSLILGHAHSSILESVRRQIELGSTFYTLSDRSIELAEELVKAIPCAELVRFASTGGEATFFALRLARAFTGKEKILKFEGSYIGHSDYGMMSVSPPRSNLYPSPHPDSGRNSLCGSGTGNDGSLQ